MRAPEKKTQKRKRDKSKKAQSKKENDQIDEQLELYAEDPSTKQCSTQFRPVQCASRQFWIKYINLKLKGEPDGISAEDGRRTPASEAGKGSQKT